MDFNVKNYKEITNNNNIKNGGIMSQSKKFVKYESYFRNILWAFFPNKNKVFSKKRKRKKKTYIKPKDKPSKWVELKKKKRKKKKKQN